MFDSLLVCTWPDTVFPRTLWHIASIRDCVDFVIQSWLKCQEVIDFFDVTVRAFHQRHGRCVRHGHRWANSVLRTYQSV